MPLYEFQCTDCKDGGLRPCTAQSDGVLAPTVCIFTFRLARWRRMA